MLVHAQPIGRRACGAAENRGVAWVSPIVHITVSSIGFLDVKTAVQVRSLGFFFSNEKSSPEHDSLYKIYLEHSRI